MKMDSLDLLTTWSNAYAAFALLACFYLLAQSSIIVYNVWFHPLSKYPGPRSWVAFPLLRAISMGRGRLDFDVRALHDKYGDVVRLGPDELSFTTAEAWKDIYGHGHADFRKYRNMGIDPKPKVNIIASNPQDHFRFRRAMLPAFSNAALGAQEMLMQEYVGQLVQKLNEVAATGQATNIVRWYMYTTFDMIGDLAFGEEFNGLKEGKNNDWLYAIQGVTQALPPMIILLELPIIGKLLAWLLRPTILRRRQNHEDMSAELTMKRLMNEGMRDRGDFVDMIMRHKEKEHGLSDAELATNAEVLIIAGAETTATLLSGVTYYLLSNPDKMRRVQSEVRTAFENWEDITFKEASSRLPYMLACLNEALRLFPPVASVLSRITPQGAPTPIAGSMVPGNTRVGVHHLAAYHSDRHFHLAREFHPERWMDDVHRDPANPFHRDDRELHLPFSFGPRNCIGKNLAYHEMRLILAKVLWSFDMELMPEMRGWAETQKTVILWEKPPLMVKVQARDA